jgi:hypothetical protein
MYVGGYPFSPEARALWSVTFKRQPDPALERMRREVWRRYGHLALWMYGFPVLAVGVAALVLIFFPH